MLYPLIDRPPQVERMQPNYYAREKEEEKRKGGGGEKTDCTLLLLLLALPMYIVELVHQGRVDVSSEQRATRVKMNERREKRNATSERAREREKKR